MKRRTFLGAVLASLGVPAAAEPLLQMHETASTFQVRKPKVKGPAEEAAGPDPIFLLG